MATTADTTRAILLADRGLTNTSKLTNTDLMSLVLADGTQKLITKTGASAGWHLTKLLKRYPVSLNPFFEVDLSGWSVTGATIARNTSIFHEGIASCALTPDGITTIPRISGPLVKVSPGMSVFATAVTRTTTTRDMSVNVDWSDATPTYVSTASTRFTQSAGNWVRGSVTYTVPAGMAYARITIVEPDTPLITDIAYIDEAYLSLGI